MILELDAGNTRVKWRLVQSHKGVQERVAQGAVYAFRKAPSVFIDLGLQLDKLPLTEISRTRISNVRGESFRESLSSLMAEKWHMQAEFAKVERTCGGVTNAYADFSSMGIDRWLAMLAAFRNSQGACCILDCGSAVTLDMVDAGGTHLGGYIVPGINMMREALANKSGALKFDSEPSWNAFGYGRSSREAVDHGILCMVLGLVEKVHGTCRTNSVDWYITGGDGHVLSRYIGWDHQVVPDLVMDGLSIAMP